MNYYPGDEHQMSFFTRNRSTAETASASTPPPPPSTTSPATTPSTPRHSRLGFSARHAMVTTVRGAVHRRSSGTAHIDTANPAASTVTVSIDAEQHRHRQRRPRRPPHAPATSSTPRPTPRSPSSRPSVEREDASTWPITGDLTIKGVTKPVTHRVRVHRLRPGPVRQPPRRLRGRHRHQPQGLGPDLERRARDRRRARLREDQALTFDVSRDPERLTNLTTDAGPISSGGSCLDFG